MDATATTAPTTKTRFVPFEDGQRPGGATNKATTLLVEDTAKASSHFVAVFDGVLPDAWCDRAYAYAVAKGRPWGAYVPTTDVTDPSISPDALWDLGGPVNAERAMALVVTRELVFNKGHGYVAGDADKIAGTAVWCLASGISNEVEYHIDYAELYRYETNCIHPPLYAATCHVSPFHGAGDMVGGDFCVNLGGLPHYKKFGYKGRLASKEAFAEDLATGADWLTVRYKRNRGILYDGTLPHLSTPVKEIHAATATAATATAADDGAPRRRVILGLNCFTHEVDACCRRAPEHSDAFNRTVKLYQKMASLSSQQRLTSVDDTAGEAATPIGGGSGDKPAGALSAKDVAKNPALARLLVLAARNMKKKQQQEADEEATRLQCGTESNP